MTQKPATLSLPLLAALCAAAGVLGSACGGYQCEVNDEPVSFASCEALQQRYAAERSRLDPAPDTRVLRDLDTCGAINACEVQQ